MNVLLITRLIIYLITYYNKIINMYLLYSYKVIILIIII